MNEYHAPRLRIGARRHQNETLKASFTFVIIEHPVGYLMHSGVGVFLDFLHGLDKSSCHCILTCVVSV